MVTYSAKATASASVVAQFFFRREETVTATASATAESNISEEDAYNIALQIAQENANSAAQNDANVIIQSVNTSTLGDNILFLSSSLLKDFVEKVEDNVYNLIKNLNIPRLLKLIIGPKEALKVGKGLTANMAYDNFGTINVEGGTLRVGGAPEGSTKDLLDHSILKDNNLKTTLETKASYNYGTINVSSTDSTSDIIPSVIISEGYTQWNPGTIVISANTSLLLEGSGAQLLNSQETTTPTITINDLGLIQYSGTGTSYIVNFVSSNIYFNTGAGIQAIDDTTSDLIIQNLNGNTIYLSENMTLTIPSGVTLQSNIDSNIQIGGNSTTTYTGGNQLGITTISGGNFASITNNGTIQINS